MKPRITLPAALLVVPVVVALLAFSCAVRADESVVGIHIATYHTRPGFKNINPGVYVRTDWMIKGLTLGVYRNSENAPAAYVGKTWETDSRRFAVTVGLVSGYKAAPVLPIIVPSIRQPLGAWALRVGVLPKPPGDLGVAGVHFSIERDMP